MIDWEALAAPFALSDIEWRIAQAGKKGDKIWAKCLVYITNRAIMDRLDEVVGPDNWRNEYRDAPGGGILCGISIRVEDEWVTKWDGAEHTDIEAVKGGLSGAMKRAAVQWGMGRYLYRVTESWAKETSPDSKKLAFQGQYKEGNNKEYFSYTPPDLPSWALPSGTVPAKPAPDPQDDPKALNDLRETVAKKYNQAIEAGVLDDAQRDRVNDGLREGTIKDLTKTDHWLDQKLMAHTAKQLEPQEAVAQ